LRVVDPAESEMGRGTSNNEVDSISKCISISCGWRGLSTQTLFSISVGMDARGGGRELLRKVNIAGRIGSGVKSVVLESSMVHGSAGIAGSGLLFLWDFPGTVGISSEVCLMTRDKGDLEVGSNISLSWRLYHSPASECEISDSFAPSFAFSGIDV